MIRKLLTVFTFSMALLVCAVSCQDKNNEPPTPVNPGQPGNPSNPDNSEDVTYKNAIRISIFDDFSSSPIYDAVVTDQNGNTAEQTSDGKYLFKDLVPGTYKVDVSRRGYNSVSKSFTLTKDGFIDNSVYLKQNLGKYEISSWNKDIVFTVNGIKRTSDGTVDIYYDVENKSDKSVLVDIRGYHDDSYAIDNFGNRYKPTYLKLSSNESNGSVTIRVFDQVQPMAKLPGILRFTHVNANATGFKAVSMFCYTGGIFSIKNLVMPGGPAENQSGPDSPDPDTPDNPGSDINKPGMYKLKLTDAFTGKDIRDAIITFDNGNTMTYQNGAYTINNLDFQGYEMKIERRGYISQRHYVYASENPKTEEMQLAQEVGAQWTSGYREKLVVTGIDRTFDNEVTVYALYEGECRKGYVFYNNLSVEFPSIDRDTGTKATDNRGNVYSVSYRSANSKDSFQINFENYELGSLVQVPIVIKFKNVSDKAKEFSKIVIIKYDGRLDGMGEDGGSFKWYESSMELNNVTLIGGPNI